MNKEKKETEGTKEPNQTGVSSYFTKEINDSIVEMSSKEMESLLKEMINSRQWIAIMKYIGIRTVLLESQLRMINPSKDPHTLSWSQGALAGICDIENYIIDINAPVTKKKEEHEVNTNISLEGKI